MSSLIVPTAIAGLSYDISQFMPLQPKSREAGVGVMVGVRVGDDVRVGIGVTVGVGVGRRAAGTSNHTSVPHNITVTITPIITPIMNQPGGRESESFTALGGLGETCDINYLFALCSSYISGVFHLAVTIYKSPLRQANYGKNMLPCAYL